MKTISKILSVVLCLAMVVGFFTFGAAAAETADHVVINQVYGGGGNNGATYKYDYIVLYNPTSSPVDITGWTLQYASASGAFNNKLTLSGTIPANGYFYVRARSNNTDNGTDLPGTFSQVDDSVLQLGASNFKLALATNSTTVENPNSSNVVDYVGAGTAGAYEGNGAASAPDKVSSIVRKTHGADTNDNSADFTVADATPAFNNTNIAAPSSGNTGSGNEGSGNEGSGNTGSGNTGSGNTGSGNTGSTTTATIVTSPVVGTAYKLGLQQVNVNKTLFFSGAMDGNFYGTTDNAASAPDVYLESATGGYYLYFMNGTTKTYLNLEGYMSGNYQKAAVKLGTEATTVFTYDANIKAFISEVGTDSFVLGTYGTYETISSSSTYYITGDKASEIGVSQFLACLYTSDGTGSGNTGSGNTGSGNTGSGNTGSDNTGSGNTGSGNEGDSTTSAEYEKVTDGVLTSGKYVLVANNGYAPTTFSSNWVLSVKPTVSGNKVTDAKGAVVTLTVSGSKVTITDSEGNAIINESAANKLTTSAGATWNWKYANGTFTFDDGNTEEGQLRYFCSAEKDADHRFRAYRGPFDEADEYGNLYYNQFTVYKLAGSSSGDTGSSGDNKDEDKEEDKKPAAPVIDHGVKNPAADTAYKFGMYQENLKKYLYFAGTLDSRGYYLATTENYAEAVDVFVEAATNGYYMYFMNGTVKTYIDIFVTENDYVNLRLVTEPSAVYTWNAEHRTFTTKLTVKGEELDYYVGTYNEYETLSGSKLSYISTSFPTHMYIEEPAPTGDNTVVSVAIAALIVSAMGATALVMKKKEF